MPEVQAQRPTRIMGVADPPANLRLLNNVLLEPGYQVNAFQQVAEEFALIHRESIEQHA